MTPLALSDRSPQDTLLSGRSDGARDSFWSRIATELANDIAQGVYLPGHRLPSEHALAQQFGVNRHTIRRSLASLCGQGLLRATQGSGTYVQDFAVELALGKRTRHRENLVQAGLAGGLRVLTSQTVMAPERVARKLQLQPDALVLCLTVLGDADGVPLQVSERYFPLPRFQALEPVIARTGSITEAFQACGVADYTRYSSRIGADMPDEHLADRLHQPVTRPVLKVESLNVDVAGLPIEFSTAWFAADRVTLNVTHQELVA